MVRAATYDHKGCPIFKISTSSLAGFMVGTEKRPKAFIAFHGGGLPGREAASQRIAITRSYLL